MDSLDIDAVRAKFQPGSMISIDEDTVFLMAGLILKLCDQIDNLEAEVIHYMEYDNG
jgi:hypothetical protein